MKKYTKPSKEEVRAWLKDRAEKRTQPPSLEQIRNELWCPEKTRKGILS